MHIALPSSPDKIPLLAAPEAVIVRKYPFLVAYPSDPGPSSSDDDAATTPVHRDLGEGCRVRESTIWRRPQLHAAITYVRSVFIKYRAARAACIAVIMLVFTSMVSLVMCSAIVNMQYLNNRTVTKLASSDVTTRRHGVDAKTTLPMLDNSSSSGTDKCLYNACGRWKPGMLNVHIICHTHDDVGWVHTVDFYYEHNVKHILNSVTDQLEKDPNRKFIYVEMAFFTRWWNNQTETKKEKVRQFVQEGRLEFISGGWSMTDEATTHYSAIIDEMSLGVRWLNATFGECARPRAGWQIDPFGHAREEAAIFRQMGFDGLFLGRIHFEDKKWKEEHKEMELLWKTDPNRVEDGALFTSVLPNVYWPPKGFCFDMWCNDPHVTEINGNDRALEFIDMVKKQAQHYATNHTVITMGMDFHFQDAEKQFVNIDALIKYVNQQNAGVNVFYSTPSCYLKALSETGHSWSTFTKDFFPYADGPHAYWTGYFTSRPNFKFFGRQANGILQSCKQMATLVGSPPSDFEPLAEALGVIQHHDGMSGTEKQHVVEDYVKSVHEGIVQCHGTAMRHFLNRAIQPKGSPAKDIINFEYCPLLNISVCHATENADQVYIVVYNPKSRTSKQYVRLPVDKAGYVLSEFPNKEVPIQLVPIHEGVQRIPERFTSVAKDLVFRTHVPPLGLRVYKLERIGDQTIKESDESAILGPTDDSFIENEELKLIMDTTLGVLKAVEFKRKNLTISFQQTFWYYLASHGIVEKPSGAYAFNPLYDTPTEASDVIQYQIVKGLLVQEIHQTFKPWITQTIRLYRDTNTIEFDWVVGPIPWLDENRRNSFGKEVVSRFSTTFDNGGEFFTDSNGRQTIRRRFNERRPWSGNITEKIASNYYPVVSWIYLQDRQTNMTMTVLPDRAQGGTSSADGQIELMVHRRLQYDDGFGVEEPLDEYGIDQQGLIAKGKHYVHFDFNDDHQATQRRRIISEDTLYAPILSFIPNAEASGKPMAPGSGVFSGLAMRLPPSVHVLTLEPTQDPNALLLRLENIDNDEYGRSVSIDVSNLFSGIRIHQIRETSLGGNQWKNEMKSFHWISKGDQLPTTATPVLDGTTIELPAGHIRTFIAYYSRTL